jgi:putative ATP-binding cassette transporter
MEVLANPEPADLYNEEQKELYLKVLRAVELDKQLESKEDWTRILSGGQKQKIVFAKALLQKPDWLFLDEASSFLDEPSENKLYSLIRTELINTTIVSIAHRSTVKPHHDRVIELGVNKDRELEIISDKRQGKGPRSRDSVDNDINYQLDRRFI